ncbi:integrase [Geomonas sp. Red276]
MPKRIAPLSDITIKNAKPHDKPYKMQDGFGLHLLVTPSGGKLWRLQYRYLGKQKLLSFGGYPLISLSDARKKRDDARKLLADGHDPGRVKKEQKAKKLKEGANTFEVVAREWHEEFKSQWAEKTACRILTILKMYVFPSIGAIPISDVNAGDVLEILRRIKDRSLDTAHRARRICGQVFRFAIATVRAESNPVVNLVGALPPVKESHFAAPTDPKKVAPLLRAIDGYQGFIVVKCALKLAPLVFVRPGELRQAEWTEIDFEAGLWSIPADKMKMDEPHIVPLSRQAVAILREIQSVTSRSRWVFPGCRSSLKCMSDNALNIALRRMGFTKDEIVAHGFRPMARTMLDEVLGFRPDIIEHQLAHKVKDPNGRAYIRTTHLDARREMMQTWADYLDALKSGTKWLGTKGV